MSDRKSDGRQPPLGVQFLRDQTQKDAAFLEEMRDLRQQFEAQGSLTPEWQAFFDKAFSADGIPDTIWADFFAAVAADEKGPPLTEEEVAALIARMDNDGEAPQ